MLQIVPTPIGNLGDITLRAIQALKDSDIIIAEDTRTAGKLLKHLGIEKKPFVSYDDHSSRRKTPHIIEQLKEGVVACLISENGTPGISDPGYRLVRAAIDEGIKVVPLPGPTALIPALVASGLPSDEFTFFGFLPKTKGKKEKALVSAVSERRTAIFYESPHRIEKTLQLIDELMPDRQICIAREISKRFEEFYRGTASQIRKQIKPKGEMVLLIGK